MPQTTRPNPQPSRPQTGRRAGADARPCTLAMAIGSALGLVLPGAASAGNSTFTAPSDSSRNLGTVVTNPGNGNGYRVDSDPGRIRNGNAFNSFGRFELAQGDTVDLMVPGGAGNLINLVWDGTALINGVLNSYKNGDIGGRVFFADPHGVVIGASGVLNVGSLAIATPTTDFMERLLDPGSTGEGAAAALLRGDVPLSDGEVSILGRINARDGVRVQARAIDASGTVWVAGGTGADGLASEVAVNTGAGDGVRLVDDGGSILLVAADRLAVSGTVHAEGGDIVLQADDSVAIAGGARIDARRLDSSGSLADGAVSTGDSGDIVVAGRDIAVAAGAVLDAGATAGHAAGDIDIAAAARDRVQTGQAQAHSRVRVDGRLRGGDVSLSAASVADSRWDDPDAALATIDGQDIVELAQTIGSAIGGTIGYLAADTSAEVTLGGTARVQAVGDVTLSARTEQALATEVTGSHGSLQAQDVVSIGALYADLDTEARAGIEAGARIEAGGTLAVAAATDNSLDVSVTSYATEGTRVATTAAVSTVDVLADASVASGAVLDVGGLQVGARNQSSFSTSAVALADEEGAVGLAAAVSLQDVAASAVNAADIDTAGDVLVQAASLVDGNRTNATIAKPPSTTAQVKSQFGGDADATGAMRDLMGQGFAKLGGQLGEQGGDDASAPATPFKLGAAMIYTDGTHSASARIADGTRVRAGGDVAVHSEVVDAGIGMTASSETDGSAPDDENPGSTFALSAGVAITRLRHDSLAEIGDGASVQGEHIGVGSRVVLPMDFSALQGAVPDFSSFDALLGSLSAAKEVVGNPEDLFTSYVSASSQAEDMALGGAISHYRVSNDSRAWVGSGATLTSTADAASGAWETALAGDDRKAQWGESISVTALTDSRSMHSAGDLGLELERVGAGKDGAAVGGSFDNVVYDTTTVAGIAGDATVTTAAGIEVDATTRDHVVSLALMGGGGSSVGVDGTMALLDLSSTTLASLSRDATVEAARLDVGATQDLFTWSVSGALAMSNSLSVGLGVAVHNLATDTRAYVGDNSADAPDAADGTVAVEDTAGRGAIRVDDLSVQAGSTGMSGAVAVAGAVAKSSNPPPADAKPGFIAKLKDSAQSKVDSLRSTAADKFAQLPLLDKVADKVRGEQGAGASDEKPAEPKFGISISGSASVNLADQKTAAYLDGAHVSGRSGGAGVGVDVESVNDTTLASASGSAAITLAKADSSKFSAAIGGAVAYGQVDNDTSAYLSASALADTRDVGVRALSGGEQTNVALGVSVNKSTDQSTAVSVAGSFSIGRSSNTTRAWLDDSILTGGGALDVTAYGRTRIGTGAGSLYFGGRGGIGAAFTYSEIADRTEAGVSGGAISGYGDFTLRALDASRIVAGAAMGGGGSDSNGLAGAVVYNNVGNTTRAAIVDGATVSLSGDLLAHAGSTAPVQAFEDRLRAVGDGGDEGIDYEGQALQLDIDGVDYDDPGNSIIAVAGLVQAGKNNIGLSFVGNEVNNTHTVEIAGATIDAGGKAQLSAADSTAILGFSIGAGVATDKFAGMGNATANVIGNRTEVLLGADGTSTRIRAGSISADARDASFIGSVAGNVAVGSKAAVGAAVTYNDIGNRTAVEATGTTLESAGAVDIGAGNEARIVSAAIAGAVGDSAAISGSFAWSETGNATLASLGDSRVDAASLSVRADSGSDILTLSGSIAASGTAAIGAAINVAKIEDRTEAELVDSRIAVDGEVEVEATGTGTARSLAVAGAVSNNVSVGGSSSNSIVNNTIAARASGLDGLVAGEGMRATRLSVRAENTGEADSLAGAISASSSVAVGGALSVNTIGGETRASLSDSLLDVSDEVAVEAVSRALVNTVAGTGSGSANVGIAGAATTNVITSATRASLSDTGLDSATADTRVVAVDSSQINSLAGSLGFAGNVGVGAAVAVNVIGSETSAEVTGGDAGRRYHGRNLLVSAEANSDGAIDGGNINTIAAGIGGGGTAGGAASVAVNVIDGGVTARIGDGADVVAEHNVGVLAGNTQGINVFAGSLAIGSTAGVGLGTTVNVMEGRTEALVQGGDTRVSALGKDAGDVLLVDAGDLADPDAVGISQVQDIGDYVAPDLSGSTAGVTGLAVNAASRQHVTTIGASGAVSFNPIGSAALAAMAGVSVVGGETRALIEGAQVNQHGGYAAGAGQQVDVRASSHGYGASFVAGIAGSGGVSGAGALATNVFGATTEAGVDGATLSARGGVVVDATASQNSLAVAAGLAAGLAGGAGTGVVNVFNASTEAYLRGGSLQAGSLSIDAANRNAASLVGGAVAGGGAAVAGTFLVNVSETRTRASLGGAGGDTTVDSDGDVAVRAHTDTGLQGIAVSGAGAGGAAIAGMAQVNVVGNTTEALVQRTGLDSGGDVVVDAQEDLALRAYSGALGISSNGVGIGAGASVAVLGSRVRAAVVDSDLDAGGSVAVTAGADREVEMLTLTAGVGGTTGIGGAAGLLLSGVGGIGDSGGELGTTFSKLGELGRGDKFDATVTAGTLDQDRRDRLEGQSRYDLTGAMDGREDRVVAVIGDSTVAADSVSVLAENVLATRNLAGGAGVGGVGVGGALAFTGLYGSTVASIEQSAPGRSRIDAGAVAVKAENRDGGGAAARVEAYAGGAGIVGVGAAVAVARVEQEVAASAGGTLQGSGGVLKIEALDSGSIDVDAIGAAVGAAAVGIVVADARRDSEVSAALAGAAGVGGFDRLQVQAGGTGGVSAYGLGAAGGLAAAGTGVGVTARDETTVLAEIGDGAAVNTSGGVQVQASARPSVAAEGLGAAVAGYAAVGAVIVEAGSDNEVAARVGDDVLLQGQGGLQLTATLDHADGASNVSASSTAGTGGVFFSANAATARAENRSRVSAQTGTGLRLGDGDVTIHATNLTAQSAEALGVAVGGIAAGAVVVDAVSDTTTRAVLGDGARHHDPQRSVGRIDVAALGVDANRAAGTAGSGGLVAGNAASVDTDGRATVEALIGNGVALAAADVDVGAEHRALYAAQSDSTNAAVIGGSGSYASNRAQADVHAGIGADAVLLSGDGIGVTATNRFESTLDHGENAVVGAAGGVISGSAAGIETRLAGSSRADVGARAQLVSGLDAGLALPGNINVVAATIAATQDNASLSTGGAIDVAVVSADASGDFGNAVSIGNDAWLNSQGYINLGTYTRASLGAQALVNTWGLAAVGVADSDVRIGNAESVTVGGGALLESLRNTYITAGRDAIGLHDTLLTVGSVAEGYVRGLIAIPDASASGEIESYANTAVGAGSQALSASNVTVGAYTGSLSFGVSGVGHGYQLGFIPVTQRDSDRDSRTRGTVVIDGDLLAGRYNQLDIAIDADGNLVQHAGLPVQATRISGFRPRDFLAGLCQDDAGSDGCKALSALQGSVAAGPVNAWQLSPLYAAGGDVFLHGDSISGTGSATAQGAPTISVVNNSNYYLLLDEIEVPDYSGGHVRFTGTAGGAAGVALAEEPADATPSVFIHNAWQGSDGPAIFAMEDIRNIGGLVHLRNDQGSLGQFGTVYAQQQLVEAPNGIVTFSNKNADWFSGSNPQSDWRGLMLRPSSADDAAAYIANIVYGTTPGILYQPGPNGDYAGSSIVLYGHCAPHTAVDGCGGGPYGGIGFRGATMPVVPGRTLSKVIDSYADNPAVAANAADSSFVGQQIYVRARYIDVNSTIDAGAGTDWSLKVLDDAGLSTWLAEKDAGPGGLYEIPPQYVTTVGTDSRLIKAWYDASEQRILVDNVNASGGGYVYLDGAIVSTTPYGKVKVSSGFGQVHIDSGIDRQVQLQDINVGNGAVGVVEIVDRLKGGPDTPYVTWYVSRQGQDPVAYDNRNGATSYDDANAFRLGDAATYNPQAGTRYGWTETAYIRRSYDPGDVASIGNWYWVDASGNVLDPGQQWKVTSAGFYQGTAGGPVFSQTITGSFTQETTLRVDYGACDDGECNYGFPTPPNGAHWDQERNSGKGDWETWWQYRYPLRGNVNLNANVKADNAIGIDFSGADSGLVDVDARGDLLLGGRIWNPGGLTRLATEATAAGGAGDIVRTGETAMVTTQRLEMDAAGGIGNGGRGDVQVTLTPGGSLVARAGAAGVKLDVWSDAAVNIVSGDAAGGYGDVSLAANGNITGLAGYGFDVEGRNLRIESRYGAIGTAAGPLRLRAHETVRSDNSIDGGLVWAKALNDVSLAEQSGDLWLGSVVSEAGDVRLESGGGALLDASLRTSTDGLSDEQIRRIRQQLRLDGSGVDDSVAAFEAQVKARYDEYWRLRELGTLDGGRFEPDARAIALFRGLAEAAAGSTGLSDQQVADYVAGRYQALVDYFDGVYGDGWQASAEFAGYDTAFAYRVQAGSQQYQDLSRNSVWTEEQLRYAINANALAPSGGAVGAAEPTVSGRNVTLVAGTGIGRLAGDLDLEYARLVAGDLDSDEALALALANTPGDVQMVGPDGTVLSRDELLALDDDAIRAGAIAYVRIKRTSPLFVAVAGRLNGSAGGNAYLQANGDLRVESFGSGGDARLAASGSLTDADPGNGAAITTGGDLVLAAGNGSIGTDAGTGTETPLEVSIGGRLLSATAGQNVLLRDLDGDFAFDGVFAAGRVLLDAQDGSLLSHADGVAVEGRDIELRARDDIGRRAEGAASGLTGPLQVRLAGNGQLDGEAGGRIWISGAGDLGVGRIQAGGDLDLVIDAGDLAGGELASLGGSVRTSVDGATVLDGVSAADLARLASTGDLAVRNLAAARADLVAGGEVALTDATVADALDIDAGGGLRIEDAGRVEAGSVAIDAAAIAMGTGSAIAAGHRIDAATAGDMRLGRLQITGDASGDGIGLAAGGGIAGNGDDVVHLAGGAQAAAVLQAGTGIGSAEQPLRVSIGTLDARSMAGDIHLQLPDGGHIGQLSADAGNVRVEAGDRLAFGRMAAARAMTVLGTDLAGGEVRSGVEGMVVDATGAVAIAGLGSGGDARLDSGAGMRIDALAVAGDLRASAGAGLELATATVGGDAALQSRSSSRVDELAVGGRLDAAAGTDLSLALARVGGAASLRAGNDALLGDLASGGTLAMLAHRDIRFSRLDSGADLLGTADTGDILGGTATAAGRIRFQAPGDIRFDGLRAGTRIDLLAGNDVAGGSLRADGTDVDVRAGRDIAVDTLDAARDIRLLAGRRLQLGTVNGGRDLWAQAGDDIAFDRLAAVRNLSLASAGDITGGSVRAGNGASLRAGGSIALDAADTGGDLALASGGDADVGRYTVGGTTRIDAGGDIGIGQGQGSGAQSLAAGGGIGFERIAGRSAVAMEAGTGSIHGALLEAPEAYLSARERIGLDMARIGGRLNLAAAEIFARVEQTGQAPGPLSMVLTGYRGGVARRVELSVDARDAWIIDRLAALQAQLDTTVTDVTIADGRIEENMRLTTPRTTTWMENRNATLVPADVQLIQPGFGFSLRQLDNHTFTDAYVVRYGEGYWVEAPNHRAPHTWTDVDYAAESALRFAFRSLEQESWEATAGALQAFFTGWPGGEEDDPVDPTVRGAVNVGISQ